MIRLFDLKNYPFFLKLAFFLVWGISLYFGAKGTLLLKFKPDPMSFMPEKSREANAIKEIQKDFGLGETGIVIIKFKKQVGRKEILIAQSIARDILKKNGVVSVMSLDDIPRPVEGKEGELEVYSYTQLLIDGLEKEEDFLNAVRTDSNIYKNFISEDLHAIAIYVNFEPRTIPESAGEMINYLRGKYPELEFFFSGSPFLLYFLGEEVFTSFKISLPIATLFFIVSFYLVNMTVFSIYTILALGTAIIWSMSFISHFTRELDFVTVGIPTVLFASGASYVAHILIKGMKSSFIPVMFSALTTASGFASMLVLRVSPMRTFGIITALGIIFVWFATILVTVMFKKEEPDEKIINKLGGPLVRLIKLIVSFPRTSLIIAFLLLLLSILRIPTSPVKLGLPTLFEKRSDKFFEIEKAEKLFPGEDFIFTLVRAPYHEPQVLRASDLYENILMREGCSFWSQSPAQIVKQSANYLTGFPRIPLDRKRLGEILFLVEGERGFRQLVNGKEKFIIMSRSRGEEWNKCLKVARKAGRDSFEKIFEIVESESIEDEELKYLFEILRGFKSELKENELRDAIFNFSFNNIPHGTLIWIEENVKNWGFGSFTSKEREMLERILKQKGILNVKDIREKIIKENLEDKKFNSALELILEKRAEARAQHLELSSKDSAAYLLDLEDGLSLKRGNKNLNYVITGSNTAFAEVDRAVKRGQIIATLITFFLIAVSIAFITGIRKVFLLAISSFPPLLAVLFSLSIVTLMNKNFDIGSAMASSALLGMGADFAIHFLWSLRRKNLIDSIKEEAPAQFFSLLLITSGFSPMLLSDITSMKSFGMIIIIGCALSSVFSLGIIGAVFAVKNKTSRN